MKKSKFEIQNILDRRYKSSKTFQRWFNKYTLAGLMWGIIVGSLIAFAISEIKLDLPSPLKQTIPVKAIEVTPTPKPYCKDAIGCIRDIGELQGRDNKSIMTMIRIAKKESNYNEKARNKNSSARGVFQIIAGTWYSNNCVGDPLKFQDNITCAYRILDNQGLPAWEVCHTGSAKCY